MPRICLLLLTITLGITACAQAWRPADALTHTTPFLAGMATGIGIHELGHFVVAESEGYSVHLHGFSITYGGKEMPPKDHLEIASAGLQAQWVMSESVLRTHEERHPREAMPSFQAGMVMGHIAISAAYLTILKNHPYGDLRGINNATGVSTNTLALLVAIPAALDYWRLTGRQVPHWVPQLSLTAKGAGIAAVWTY